MVQNPAPYWRGFNLPARFQADDPDVHPFREEDFAIVAEWGFDWVRLPMAYTSWIEGSDPYALREDRLREFDTALALGERYGIHVNIAFHRAPGYTVSRGHPEPLSLWKDAAALEACTFHWEHFARRYRGVPGSRLSFNLWNEPGFVDETMSRAEHERAARHVFDAIRAIDHGRPIVLDGLQYGVLAMPELADLDATQSCRGYYPLQVSHHKATWVHEPVEQEATWPIAVDGRRIDRAQLERFYQPWVDLMARGVGVHCGEMGVLKYTPHPVALAWLGDVLGVLAERRIGFALWNLHGSFGPLDSDRQDVRYEPFRGHRLDRAMLELLQRH